MDTTTVSEAITKEAEFTATLASRHDPARADSREDIPQEYRLVLLNSAGLPDAFACIAT